MMTRKDKTETRAGEPRARDPLTAPVIVERRLMLSLGLVIERLDSSDPAERRVAARCLGSLADLLRREAVGALGRAAHAGDKSVKKEARKALWRMLQLGETGSLSLKSRRGHASPAKERTAR